MIIALFGGTGFTGTALAEHLHGEGHDIRIFTRTPTQKNHFHWNPASSHEWENALTDVDIIINLAGSPIADKRWTPSQKETLIRSRILPTKSLVDYIQKTHTPPKLFINASAIGFYASTAVMPTHSLTEDDSPGTDFLSQLCQDWEAEANRASQHTRVITLRTAIVLGEGGFIKKVAPFFKVGLGVVLGDGKAPFPWIHLTDFCRIISFCISHNTLSGPINCVAPESITSNYFFTKLAASYNHKLRFRLPNFIVRLIFGEMSQIFLSGHNAAPQKLLASGFTFHYPTLEI